MRITLIRHGQTDWNRDQRAQGHTDIPLNAEGERQTQALVAAYHGESLQHVWSSDLRRAAALAEQLAEVTQASLRLTTDLRERGFGVLEGEHYTVIRRAVAESDQPSHQFTPEGGESMEAVHQRLGALVQEVLKLDGHIALVSHGGTSALLASMLLGAGPELSRAFRFANASVTMLERRTDGHFELVRYNDISHLTIPHTSSPGGPQVHASFGVIG